MIYQIVRDFPQEEKYSLADQMRRSAVSISSNIAEGFSRFSDKEKVRFYYLARGSLTELQNQLLVSKDVGYISKDKFTETSEQIILAHKLINGLIRKKKL